MKRILPLLLALVLALSTACAETAEDAPVATVNGEALPYSTYYAIESAYMAQYESFGFDLADETLYTYVQDLALSYAVEQLLVKQDMIAQGCYVFDEQTEAWFIETGKAAYESAMNDVIESLRSYDPSLSEDELAVYALAYAESLAVTEQTYIDFYRDQYASENYNQWLIRQTPVTAEDVQAAYAERVAASQAAYENDIAAFETAMNNGSEVWYKPAGYRSILQILLPAQGDTAEDKIASVQAMVDDITARLEKGESFQSLIAEYGTDANFTDEAFMAAGYQVHKSSILWEDAFISAAFSEEMAQPGCWSKPFASDLGVHILYYLCDSAAGPIELTEELDAALSYVIYSERAATALTERLNELSDAAQIVFH